MDNRTPSIPAHTPSSTPEQTIGAADSAPPVDRRFLLGGLAGVAGISALAAIAGGGSRASAGPIDPPAGPVGPTPGPEARTAVNSVNTPGTGAFAFRITQPGSYYLAGNIQLSNNLGGIEIAASGVTLDLNGFTLDGGYAGVGASNFGAIAVSGARSNITIANGQISNWADRGVGVGNASAASIALHGLQINVGLIGIDVNAPGTRITGCSVRGGQVGIQLSGGASVTGCTVRSTSAFGFTVQDGSTLEGCTASACNGTGFSIGGGSTLVRCAAAGNGQSGFIIANACSVTACVARSNGLAGFNIASGCNVQGCTADSNSASGISVIDHCVVESCTSTANGAVGISARQANTIRRNLCSVHGGANSAGILLTTFSPGLNRVEENTAVSNTRGYWVQSPGNILMRNTSSANTTHWQIAGGNSLHVITPASPPAFTGATGGLPLSVAGYDPNVNFTV